MSELVLERSAWRSLLLLRRRICKGRDNSLSIFGAWNTVGIVRGLSEPVCRSLDVPGGGEDSRCPSSDIGHQLGCHTGVTFQTDTSCVEGLG